MVCIGGAALAALSGCGPAWKELSVETDPNQAVFTYTLEGDTLKNQRKINPGLGEAKRIQAQRIVVDQRRYETGRWWQWWSYDWIPSQKVVKVSLTPVTREWTGDSNTGTSTKNQALQVESANSINYTLPANIRCSITRGKEHLFLNRFSGKSLEEVVDGNVWGYAQARVAYYCGRLDIDETLSQLGEISEKVARELSEKFEPYGITVEKFGLFGGLSYDNPEIQTALNDVFTAQNDKLVAKQEQAAQRQENEILLQRVQAERRQALALWNSRQGALMRTQLELMQKDVDAAKAAVERWDGAAPGLVPENAGMTAYFFGRAAALDQIKELVNTKSEVLDRLASAVAAELKAEAEARAKAASSAPAADAKPAAEKAPQ